MERSTTTTEETDSGSPRVSQHRPVLQVTAVREATAFAALRGEWAALLDASEASMFNSWEWLYAWYRRLGRDRKLYILTARDSGGELAGLMPMCIEHRRALGHMLRRLSFLGETEVCSDFMDVVALPERLCEVVEAFAAFLQQAREEWDVLDLLDMDSQSPTIALLRESFAGGGYESEVREGEICPRITFAADETFDNFIRTSGRRENYIRRKKWLEKQPGFSIDLVEDPAAIAAPFGEFLYLHSLRWAGEGGSAGIRGPQVEAFHRYATVLLAERNKLRLFTLRVEGKAVAAVYGLRHRDTFSYYQAGRDPEWNNRSVGMVLLAETFKRSLESGVHVYDFLRGEEGYKLEWSNDQRRLVELRIYARGGAGKWLGREQELSKSARRVAKRLLPESLKERVKRGLTSRKLES